MFGRYKRAFSHKSNETTDTPHESDHDGGSPQQARVHRPPPSVYHESTTLGGFSLGTGNTADSDDSDEEFSVFNNRMIDPKTGNFRIVKINRGSMWQVRCLTAVCGHQPAKCSTISRISSTRWSTRPGTG